MGFWNRLFKRNKPKDSLEDDWEQIVYDRDDVDFNNEEQRSRYITNCLEQISEASREINLLTGEYTQVTSYLTDMEELEALPENEKTKLDEMAARVFALEQECEKYRRKRNRMEDAVYYRMKKQEDEVAEGISKLSECENYGRLIKQDLQRLDRERHAYEYRRSELHMMMNNYRGMVLIFFSAFVVFSLVLAVLQFGLQMNTKLGFVIAFGAVAISVTVLVTRYMESDKELGRVESAVNRLIQLQNKVKIRYVNNSNLREYLCMKYDTDNADTLKERWRMYQEEKEERREYAEAEGKLELLKERFLERLKSYHVSHPERWTDQSGALLDKREMVELRHEMILRRQALRKQMDYNTDVAQTARKEIMEIVEKYPAYASEILSMVEQYDSDY